MHEALSMYGPLFMQNDILPLLRVRHSKAAALEVSKHSHSIQREVNTRINRTNSLALILSIRPCMQQVSIASLYLATSHTQLLENASHVMKPQLQI